MCPSHLSKSNRRYLKYVLHILYPISTIKTFLYGFILIGDWNRDVSTQYHFAYIFLIPSLLFIVFKGFKKRLRDVENKCFDSYDITCTSETKTPNFPVSFYNVSASVRGWANCAPALPEFSSEKRI